jgi:hypothetical protein
MKVPDNIILLWTDDNSGNLLRTPYSNETDRPGGAGVYYHFDDVGVPRNYKWINTIQLRGNRCSSHTRKVLEDSGSPTSVTSSL